jgi:ankyrin repeat protein
MLQLTELIQAIQENKIALLAQEPNASSYTSTQQSGNTLAHHLVVQPSAAVEDVAVEDEAADSGSDDEPIELHAFGHLRDSIRIAEKKVEETIRTSRPPSVRSAKPRRGSVDRIDSHDAMGWTPLVAHIISKQHAMVHWALDNGADAEVKCHGKAPLLYVIQSQDLALLQILLEYQPTLDIEARDSEGKTALAIAALQGDANMIDALLENGADIESRTPSQETPLMLAAQSGELEAVETLIRNGANCTATDQDGWSTLHHGVHGPDRQNAQAIIQHLINHDVDVNCLSRGDETPLHKATMDQKMYALRTLLENNADWRLKHGGRRNCLRIAVEEEHTEIVALLVNSGAVWEGPISNSILPNIKNILKHSCSDMPPPSRKYSTDSGISMGPSVTSVKTRRFRLPSFRD